MNPSQTSLKNRLLKNIKRIKKYLDKNGIEAYRLYNKDIPEYPYLIDIYQNKAVIYEQGKKLNEEDIIKRNTHQTDIENVILDIFAIDKKRQYFKIRQIQKGNDQYRPINSSSPDFFSISEPPFNFLVNLERYLDTGLFLDHRPLRQHLFKTSSDKKVLNLFCYTGSLSVAAAMGGGQVTSIDMSNTYLEWAQENFFINKIDPKKHTFLQADVLKVLASMKDKNNIFDIIILDPPSFSNSKRMDEDLDIERDHPILIRDCMSLLSTDGVLYFSTNKRKFELHNVIQDHYQVKEISQWTIPLDFHHTNIHRAYQIQKKH